MKAGMAFLFAANLAVKLHNYLFLNCKMTDSTEIGNGHDICFRNVIPVICRDDRNVWAWKLNDKAFFMSFMSAYRFVTLYFVYKLRLQTMT